MKTFIICFLILLSTNAFAQDKNLNIDSCKKGIDASLEIGFVLSNRYIISGYIDSSYSKNLKEMSFVRIRDCRYQQNIVDKLSCIIEQDHSFCLPASRVKVKKKDSTLHLTYYGSLPAGKNWQWKNVAVYKQIIGFNKYSLYKISGKCVLQSEEINISKEQSKKIVRKFDSVRVQGNDIFNTQRGFDAFASVVLKLFMCSADGHAKCQNIFVHLEEKCSANINGLLKQIYSQWLGVYYLYQDNP